MSDRTSLSSRLMLRSYSTCTHGSTPTNRLHSTCQWSHSIYAIRSCTHTGHSIATESYLSSLIEPFVAVEHRTRYAPHRILHISDLSVSLVTHGSGGTLIPAHTPREALARLSTHPADGTLVGHVAFIPPLTDRISHMQLYVPASKTDPRPRAA